jgi:CheY-like chemotaxis protein
MADPGRLRQVLLNLLGNAIRYTERGSVKLCFRVQPGEDAEHLQLTFEVEDTGVGIAPEDRERIFEPFVQVGKHSWRKGTGLGLTITRQLVGLMQGTIGVESTPGEGSCFRVEIPAERAHELRPKAVPEAWERVTGLEEGQPEYRILIVDNERENWMLLQRLLTRIGFAVRIAENGAEGIETFVDWHPHFIWMDLNMPVMNGLEATRRIRALEGGQVVKIVAVTASRFSDDQSEVLAAGLDDFVLKPYRLTEVFDCMARHLGVRYRRTGVLRTPAT